MLRKKKAYATLIGIIVVLVIIFFLVWKGYFEKPPMDEKTKESLSQQGIDASTRQKLLETTKKKVEQINKKSEEVNKKMEELGY